MPFSIRLYRRFPVQGSVTNNAGPFLTLRLPYFSGFESVTPIEGRASTELYRTQRGYEAEKNREDSNGRVLNEGREDLRVRSRGHGSDGLRRDRSGYSVGSGTSPTAGGFASTSRLRAALQAG
jgi:hypothetical protein